MMRDLATTHANSGVTFNAYAPGAATRTYYEYMAQLPPDKAAELQAQSGAPGPGFIAPMVTWLCTEAAAQVTGEVFTVTGGTIARWTRFADAASLVKADADGAGLWTLDELDEHVPQHLLPRP